MVKELSWDKTGSMAIATAKLSGSARKGTQKQELTSSGFTHQMCDIMVQDSYTMGLEGLAIHTPLGSPSGVYFAKPSEPIV